MHNAGVYMVERVTFKPTLIVYCDATRTRTAASFAFVALEQRHYVGKGCGWLGRVTSVCAETLAVIQALEWLQAHPCYGRTGRYRIFLKTDCSAVVKFLDKPPAPSHPELSMLAWRMKFLLERTGARLQWIPREANKQADSLSRSLWRDIDPARWEQWQYKHNRKAACRARYLERRSA